MLPATILLVLLTVAVPSLIEAYHLRVGYVERPPSFGVEYDEHNQAIYYGYTVEILKWISVDLNFTYELINVNYSDGFAGMAREFVEKNLDLGLPIYGLSEERNHIMKPLFPFDYGDYRLIIPYPKLQSDPWSFTKPFEYPVWLLLLTSLVILTILFKLTATGQNPKNKSATLDSVYLIGVLTNQGGYCSSKASLFSRLVAALWCLAALVLVNAYSGSLITYMTSPKVSPLVNSVEETARRGDIQFLALKSDFIQILLETGPVELRPLAVNLARALPELCGWDVENSTEFDNCVRKIKNGDHVMGTDSNTAFWAIRNDFQQFGECGLTVAESAFFPNYAGFVGSLDTTQELRNSLDASILKAASYGLIENWAKQCYPARNNPCTKFRSQPRVSKRLSLFNLKGAFIVLGLGYGLSFVAFVYELRRNKFLIAKLKTTVE